MRCSLVDAYDKIMVFVFRQSVKNLFHSLFSFHIKPLKTNFNLQPF